MISTLTRNNQGKTNPLLEVFSNRDFRLLWVGEGISVLGDHFYLIAVPWLVPQWTGDSLAMGITLALSAIPRALLMMAGDALADCFPPMACMALR